MCKPCTPHELQLVSHTQHIPMHHTHPKTPPNSSGSWGLLFPTLREHWCGVSSTGNVIGEWVVGVGMVVVAGEGRVGVGGVGLAANGGKSVSA